MLTCVQFNFHNSTLTTVTSGSYIETNPLANITIAGWSTDSGDIECSNIEISIDGHIVDGEGVSISSEKGTIYLIGLETLFKDGAFTRSLAITFH
jgi:alpha-glucosidase